MAADDTEELARLRDALAEAKRRGELDRAEILMLRGTIEEQRRETEHQFRNILSVVRSIARRTAVEGETAEDYQARLDSRLASFTQLQAHILRNPAGGIDLHTLISNELHPFGLKEGAQAHLAGPEIYLRPKPASVLGLAFHELACMAIAGSDPVSVEVRWKTETNGGEARHLRIEWVQTSRASDTELERHFEFGREYLEQAVSYELEGEVQINDASNRFLCCFRLPTESILAS